MAGEKIKEILAQDDWGRDILENGLEDNYVSLGTFYHILRGDELKEHTDVQRYMSNMIFNLSSGAGWDIQKDKIEFIYSTDDDLVHPLDVYMPLDYVLERLENSVNFSLNISTVMQRARRERENEGQSLFFKALKGMLSKWFGDAVQEDVVDTPRERLYQVMAEAVISAQHDMHSREQLLADRNFAYYNPDSGAENPLFLSTQEIGASFDFVMRRKP